MNMDIDIDSYIDRDTDRDIDIDTDMDRESLEVRGCRATRSMLGSGSMKLGGRSTLVVVRQPAGTWRTRVVLAMP